MSTRGDAFRAMTDEEIAEFLSDNIDCTYCTLRVRGCMNDTQTCVNVFLQWLREEAAT